MQPLDGYHEVLYWKITDNLGRVLVINLLGLFLLVLSMVGFRGWAALWQPARNASTRSALELLWLIVGLLLTIVLHELVHGLAIRLFGGKPTYGVILKGLMFYATASGHAFRRDQYIGVALAPLVLGSLAGAVLLMLPLSDALAWIISICAAINVTGAIGDLWITAVVLRYPSTAYVVDEKDGMRIYLVENR